MTRAVDSGYVDAARESGLLRTVAGRSYVAGAYTDAVTGRRQVLVEYADHGLVEDPALLAELTGVLVAGHDDADGLLMRTGPWVELPRPWRTQVTYVRLAGGSPSDVDLAASAADVDFEVTTAGPEHDPLVLGWLERAFHAAGDEIEADVAATDAATAARSVLEQRGRVSLLVWHRGEPVGHATLLCAAHDEVTGTDFVELVDSLVEPVVDVRAATTALTAAAGEHAAGLGLPLFGNVVHPVGDSSGKAERVLASLRRRGWRVSHRYWFAPLGSR
ncbi:hypothetical protein [Umezawaea tangerina]|uniref:N-acetyltransferase domain-containing protein n=1 Tax=Umezawaea tangerina TaxID=84725 RepID=A0A2T0T815_9PSEU|nr:hypothetical protein [Umezawaea tangerina]PRY41797.1 hypothetical protein CLV43_105556 [Umezawaea tangerina]